MLPNNLSLDFGADSGISLQNSTLLPTVDSLLSWTFEAFVKAGGANRVLFGTDSPVHAPALECSKVLHADLSDDEKQRILGGNISRLIKDRL